jgi:hypothetical protein
MIRVHRRLGAGMLTVFLSVGLMSGSPAAATPTVVATTPASALILTPSTISGNSCSISNSADPGPSLAVYGAVAGTVTDVTLAPAVTTNCDTASDCTFGSGLTLNFEITASSATQYVYVKYSSAAPVLLTILPTAASGGGSGAGQDSGPGEHVQQTGRFPEDDCGVVDRPDLNWSGVSSDGWSPSWSHWMNDGEGGPVCTRTLSFDGSLGRWVVAN